MKVQRTSSIQTANYINSNVNNDRDFTSDTESVRKRNNLMASLANPNSPQNKGVNDALAAEHIIAANAMNAPEEMSNKKNKKIVKLKSINTKSDIKEIEEHGNYLEDTIYTSTSNRLEELQQQSLEKNMGEISDRIRGHVKRSKMQLGAAAISNAIITTGLISFDLDELSAAALVSAHAGTLVVALIALSRIPHHINIEKIFVKLMRNESLNEKERGQLEKYLDKMKKEHPELTDAKIAELLEMGKESSKVTKNHINLGYYEQLDKEKNRKVQKRKKSFDGKQQQNQEEKQEQESEEDLQEALSK